MSTPYPGPGPRPVGPPPPVKPGQPSSRPTGGSSSPGGWPPGGEQSGGYGYDVPPPGVRVWSWSSSRMSGGRPFPWFAVLLIVLGVGLLIETLVPDLSFSSLIILAAGLACGAAWLLGGARGATMPALVLTGWGLASVGTDMGILSGDGWTAFLVGVAFLIGWAVGRVQGVRRDWSLVLGLIFGVIGLADVSDALNLGIDLAVIVPLVIIGVGAYLVWKGRSSFG
jgi:hypothetical protein